MHYLFIYSPTGAIERQLQGFATILLYHAYVKVKTMVVLFVIFRYLFYFNMQVGLNRLPLASLVLHSGLLHRKCSQ